MWTGAVRLLVSLLISYFVGLTVFSLNAGVYWGLEGYGLLLLVAGIFGALAVRDKVKFGTSFLVFFNASWIFLMGAMLVWLLEFFNIVSLPVRQYPGGPDTATWVFPFGVFALLNLFYGFGFANRKRRYFFAWAETSPNVPRIVKP